MKPTKWKERREKQITKQSGLTGDDIIALYEVFSNEADGIILFRQSGMFGLNVCLHFKEEERRKKQGTFCVLFLCFLCFVFVFFSLCALWKVCLHFPFWALGRGVFQLGREFLRARLAGDPFPGRRRNDLRFLGRSTRSSLPRMHIAYSV